MSCQRGRPKHSKREKTAAFNSVNSYVIMTCVICHTSHTTVDNVKTTHKYALTTNNLRLRHKAIFSVIFPFHFLAVLPHISPLLLLYKSPQTTFHFIFPSQKPMCTHLRHDRRAHCEKLFFCMCRKKFYQKAPIKILRTLRAFNFLSFFCAGLGFSGNFFLTLEYNFQLISIYGPYILRILNAL